MERAPVECIYCGTRQRHLLIRIEKWSVYECARCGLGVLDPRPDAKELNTLYQKYLADCDDCVDLHAQLRRSERHRVNLLRKGTPNGLVLDIGCGRGHFLQACKMYGYEVMGLDISDDSATYARKSLGIDVVAGTVHEGLFECESVDAVTMWHSLEHVADPMLWLECAWKWLRPNGVLILEVPNHESTDAKQLWTEWRWHLPYHLYHFTPSVIRGLLEKQGFEVVKTNTYHSEVVKNALRPLPVLGVFARLIAKLYSGTGFAVLARKVSDTNAEKERSRQANEGRATKTN